MPQNWIGFRASLAGASSLKSAMSDVTESTHNPPCPPWRRDCRYEVIGQRVSGAVGAGAGAVLCRNHLVQEIEGREPS
jgi:hypothetical protein